MRQPCAIFFYVSAFMKSSPPTPPCCSCSLMLLLRVSVSYVSRLFFLLSFFSLYLSHSLLSFSHTSLSLTSCTFIVNYSYKIESLCGLRQSIRSVCGYYVWERNSKARVRVTLHIQTGGSYKKKNIERLSNLMKI